MFFLLFYTFVAFTVLPTKILALFVNLTLKQNALFRAIFNLPQFFWLFLLCSKIFSVSSLNRHNRPIFLRRARKNVSLPARRQPSRLTALRVHCVHPWTPSIFPAFFALSVFSHPASFHRLHICCLCANTTITIFVKNIPILGGDPNMKATGIVRRIDDLGRVVIPKEIRRTMRIREGDPSQTTLTWWESFCFGMLDLSKRQGW